jgi:hypothetical protein
MAEEVLDANAAQRRYWNTVAGPRWVDCRSRWPTMWSARSASQAHQARTTSARRRASTKSPIN